MKILRYLILVLAVLAVFGISNLFAQCGSSTPVSFVNLTHYVNLTGAPNVPGEFCPGGGGTPANAPAFRMWQFDADLTNSANFKSYRNSGPAFQNLWTRNWMCNTVTIGSYNDAHFFQFQNVANLRDGQAQLEGCPNGKERIVASIGYGTGDGTAAHSGWYVTFTAPFDAGFSAYNFDAITSAGGNGLPLGEIPQPTVDAAVPDAVPPAACCLVNLAIPNPVWFTDAGDNAQVSATATSTARDVVLGYEFRYKQAASPGPTSVDPAQYTPVEDPTNCANPLGIVPLGGGGQTQVTVAVPVSAAATPYYIVALPVYESTYAPGSTANLTTIVVSRNSVQNAGTGGREPQEVGFFPCHTTLALEFESFAVKRTPDGAKVEWTMADEEDLAYYAVEKRDYYAMGGYYTFPDGVVESQGQLRYSYSDRTFDPTLGQNFYRIVAYKYDGTSVATPSFTFAKEISKSPRAVDRNRSTDQDGGLRTRSIQ